MRCIGELDEGPILIMPAFSVTQFRCKNLSNINFCSENFIVCGRKSVHNQFISDPRMKSKQHSVLADIFVELNLVIC